MNLEFLTPVYGHPGDTASVYLDTTRAHEDAQHQIELRWRAMRDELAGAGADEATLDAIERVAGADRGVPGAHGQAIFASGGRVLLSAELPHPPDQGFARFAPLPHVFPMLTARGDRVPHVVAVVDRLGADVTTVGVDARPDEKQVQGDATYPIRKVHAGGWSEAHFQHAAENSWDQNAKQVAAEVDRAAQAVGAQVVIVAGDVRAKAALVENLGEKLRPLVVEAQSGSRAAGADEEALRQEVLAAVRARAADRVAQAVDDYRREAGQQDRAVDGLVPVVAALRRAQVARLLVRADADLSGPLWFGADPLTLASDQDELAAMGVGAEARKDRADAALIRTLTATEGELVIVPANVELRDGVGAVLRFTDPATQR
jgi:hypothetical protein